MQLVEIQFAWFFSARSQIDYEALAGSIRQKTKRPFVSPAMLIPLPPQAPAEIPRLQMNTANNLTRATVAQNRADYFVATDSPELGNDRVSEFFDDVVKFSEVILSIADVHRLGLVGRIVREEPEPAKIIASSLLKKSFLELIEASVKIVEKRSAQSFTYNDSFQFDQGVRVNTQAPLLIVTRDINTAQDVPISVNLEMIQEFSVLARERLSIAHIHSVMEN